VLLFTVLVLNGLGQVQTRLNNFVTEDVNEVDPAPGVYRFHFTEPGWVFVRTLSGGPGVRATLDADPEPLFSYGENKTDANETESREAMCYVAVGDHAVTLEGRGSGGLEVRRVPEIRYFKFQYDLWGYHDGPYDWAFLEKHMLPHVNTIVGMHDKDQSRWSAPWRNSGGAKAGGGRVKRVTIAW